MKTKSTNSNEPIWRDVFPYSKLPKKIEKLYEIATNLWWVWNHEGAKLFGEIDPILWKETEGNPVSLLQKLSSKRMKEIIDDKSMIDRKSTRLNSSH